MKCNNIKRNIPLYIEDTLKVKEYSLIEEHLKECQQCKREYNAYKRLVNELNKMECPLPGADEWDRIHEGIMKGISLSTPSSQKKIISMPLWKFTSYRIRAVAVLILLAFISFSVFKVFYSSSEDEKKVAEVLDGEGKIFSVIGISGAIKAQSKIVPGNILITEGKDSLQLKIEKSIVKVAKSSMIRVAELRREKTELELLEGDVKAQVSKRKSNQLFRIRTPNAVCEVVGTRFNVSTQYDKFHKGYITTLTVDEGIVKFGKDGNKVEVREGEGIALFGDSLGSIVLKNDPIIEQLIKTKGKGYVYVSSFPESAKIFIDKEFIGYTPTKILKPFGRYEITCKKEGFDIQKVNIDVRPEKINNIKITLEDKKGVFALKREVFSDSLYLRAMKMMNGGEFEKAVDLFKRISKDKNVSPEVKNSAVSKMLICYKNLGKYNEFIKTVDYILKGEFPAIQKANALFERATIYINILSEPENAIKDFRNYLKDFSDGIWAEEASYLLAETYLKMMRYKEAVIEYEKFSGRFKESNRREYILYKLATIYANSMNEPSRALEVYNRLILEFPHSKYVEDAMFGSADCLLRIGNTTKAITEFNNYLKRYPQGKWTAEAKLRLTGIQTVQSK